ncbi:MAG: hypothetical protein JW726_05485 [Anaerolineales bacterium]|nr:hypothetical protein [Anaerolineales bacterium]
MGFALLGLSLSITWGIGQSNEPERDARAVETTTLLWLYAPVMVNLPSLAYVLFTRRWRFLGGWGVGLLGALLLIGGTFGCIWLYIAILSSA